MSIPCAEPLYYRTHKTAVVRRWWWRKHKHKYTNARPEQRVFKQFFQIHSQGIGVPGVMVEISPTDVGIELLNHTLLPVPHGFLEKTKKLGFGVKERDQLLRTLQFVSGTVKVCEAFLKVNLWLFNPDFSDEPFSLLKIISILGRPQKETKKKGKMFGACVAAC